MTSHDEKKETAIIFESGFTGHRSLYISHLMRYINSQKDLRNKFLFVLSTSMRPLLNDLPDSNCYSCHFADFRDDYSNYVTGSFREWNYLSAIIRERPNISEMIFMDIDTYLILASSSVYKRFKLKTKGILFQPYLHFKKLGGGPNFYIRKVLKNYFLQRIAIFSNPNLEKIFILNDKQGVSQLNKNIKNIFYNIPDPIEATLPIRNESTVTAILEKYHYNPQKKNLLVFGSIDTRKNLTRIIDAIRLLPPEIRDTVHLIISGKIQDAAREKYLEHINKYNGEISMGYNDDFVKDQEREIVLEHADLILMPYINFYSASSVVGHAICYNKNIIAPDKGLLANIVRNNKLGINVNPYDVVAIKDAIYEILTNSLKYQYDGSDLIDDYNPTYFSKNILRD